MSKYKYRTLTLKHFSVPQEKSILEVRKELEEKSGNIESLYGNYISFFGHNFLMISPCEKQELSAAYDNLRHERNQKTPGSYVLQTLTLLGDEGDFWKEDPDVLYLTFLQTKEMYLEPFDDKRYENVSKRLTELFAERTPNGTNASKDFALYYSYDFCDFVLFAKNTDLKWYNNLLWRMATGGDEAFLCVRDTYSIYSFQTTKLLNAMSGICSPEIKKLKLDIALRLSVYSSDYFEKMKTALLEKGVSLRKAFIFSRYDFELRADNISGEQLAFLLGELDRSSSMVPQPFGGYELMPSSEWASTFDKNGKAPWRDEAFIKAVLPSVEADLDYIDANLKDYVRETSRSLRELLLNGFSTEFLLGTVLPYLKELQLLIPPSKDEMEEYEYAEKREELLSSNAHRFFNALNTLKLSMMHGERRFVQAPAFNATYFDIPPKLFAYYAAVMQLAAGVYGEESGRYSFLMVPDFRPGINVHPLPEKDTPDTKARLCLVYLSERYFFDPLEAIFLIFHETAHYLSVRHREERASEVFFSVGITLLANLPIGALLISDRLDALMRRDSLLGVLADEMAKALDEEYRRSCMDRHIPFSFASVWNYLLDSCFGLRIFSNSFTKERLIRKWSERIKELRGAADEEEIDGVLRELENNFNETSFLSVMYSEEASKDFSCKIIAAQVASQIDNFYLADPSETKAYYISCQNILYAYREAFADHKMLQVLKEGCTSEYYESLLKDTRTDFSELDFEFSMRHDAIIRKHFGGSDACFIREPDFCEDEEEYRAECLTYCVQECVVRGIIRYLDVCEANIHIPEILSEAIHVFSGNDPKKQYLHVVKVLSQFRKQMINSFAKENENMTCQKS